MSMNDTGPGAFDWGVGSAIAATFGVLFGNFISFVGLALLIGIPAQLLALASAPTALHLIVDLVLGQVVTITLIYGTVQSLRGRPVGIGECLSQGLGRLSAALGIAILSGLGIVIGLVLLIIPGLYLATLWAVAVPVAVVEQAGVGDSFSRSSELTEGRRWRVFGALLVSGLTVMAIDAGVAAGMGDIAGDNEGPMLVVVWIVGAITQAFLSTLSGVLYSFLRQDKEGADVDTIASVFD